MSQKLTRGPGQLQRLAWRGGSDYVHNLARRRPTAVSLALASSSKLANAPPTTAA
jgi:hypothetical protein